MSAFEWCVVAFGVLQTGIMGLTYWRLHHVEKNSNGMHTHIVALVKSAAEARGFKKGSEQTDLQ